jgi:hypothetical protein
VSVLQKGLKFWLRILDWDSLTSAAVLRTHVNLKIQTATILENYNLNSPNCNTKQFCAVLKPGSFNCILCCFANISVLWATQMLQVYCMGWDMHVWRGVCRHSKKKLRKFCSRITCIAGSCVKFLLSLQHKIKQTAETINTASWYTQIIAHRYNQRRTTASCTTICCTLSNVHGSSYFELVLKASFYCHTFYVNFGSETK